MDPSLRMDLENGLTQKNYSVDNQDDKTIDGL